MSSIIALSAIGQGLAGAMVPGVEAGKGKLRASDACPANDYHCQVYWAVVCISCCSRVTI